MSHLNIEFKAICQDPTRIRDFLKKHNAKFNGIDHQIDTYFNVSKGRLKLREGKIENYLIYYERTDKEGPKESKVTLFEVNLDSNLKEILVKSLGIKIIVNKKREIYFIENVKIHIDDVEGLGNFIEVEAIDKDNTIGIKKLQEQCENFLNEFKITKNKLVSQSYSDLLLSKK